MKKNLLEWSVFAVGVAAIVAVLFGLIRDAQAPQGSPDLRIQAGKATKVGERWLVEVKVRNLGGEAAESVAIRAEAGEQQAEFDIDYVPRDSERKGYLHFRTEPKGLKVDVSGAAAP